MGVELSVHHQHIVAALGGCVDIVVLGCGVGSIEIYGSSVLVGLRRFDKGFVFVESEEFALGVLEEHKFLGAVGKLFVGKHAILDENLDIVPLGFEVGAVLCENLVETVGDLACDVARDFLYCGVALQI